MIYVNVFKWNKKRMHEEQSINMEGWEPILRESAKLWDEGKSICLKLTCAQNEYSKFLHMYFPYICNSFKANYSFSSVFIVRESATTSQTLLHWPNTLGYDRI